MTWNARILPTRRIPGADQGMMSRLAQPALGVLAGALRRYPYRGKTALWSAFSGYLEPRRVWTRLPGGGRMLLDLESSWQIAMFAGCFERREFWLVRQLLRRGDTFIDGGANVGYYTCLAAGLVGDGAVHAFEPDARLLPQLREQQSRNPAVIAVHPVALSDEEGEAPFFTAPRHDRDGAYSLGMGRLSPMAEWTPQTVLRTTLDRFFDREKIRRVTLAKLDVEHEEARVLRGARAVLASGALESVLLELSDETRDAVAGEADRHAFDAVVDIRRGFRTFKQVAELPAGQTDVLLARGACAARWRRARPHVWLM